MESPTNGLSRSPGHGHSRLQRNLAQKGIPSQLLSDPDCACCALTRNNTDVSDARKRSSPPSRRVIVMFHCSCARGVCRDTSQSFPICIRQNYVDSDVPRILWNTFIHSVDDDYACYPSWSIIRVAWLQSVQLPIFMDRFDVGGSSPESFLSIRSCLREF